MFIFFNVSDFVLFVLVYVCSNAWVSFCYCGHGGGRRAGIGEVCVVCCVLADLTE